MLPNRATFAFGAPRRLTFAEVERASSIVSRQRCSMPACARTASCSSSCPTSSRSCWRSWRARDSGRSSRRSCWRTASVTCGASSRTSDRRRSSLSPSSRTPGPRGSRRVSSRTWDAGRLRCWRSARTRRPKERSRSISNRRPGTWRRLEDYLATIADRRERDRDDALDVRHHGRSEMRAAQPQHLACDGRMLHRQRRVAAGRTHPRADADGAHRRVQRPVHAVARDAGAARAAPAVRHGRVPRPDRGGTHQPHRGGARDAECAAEDEHARCARRGLDPQHPVRIGAARSLDDRRIQGTLWHRDRQRVRIDRRHDVHVRTDDHRRSIPARALLSALRAAAPIPARIARTGGCGSRRSSKRDCATSRPAPRSTSRNSPANCCSAVPRSFPATGPRITSSTAATSMRTDSSGRARSSRSRASGDDASFYHYIDRLKDVINRGGAKIPVGELEAAIQDHPDVSEAAAIGYPDERLGERICAVVALRPGATLTLDALVDHLSGARHSPLHAARASRDRGRVAAQSHGEAPQAATGSPAFREVTGDP